MTTKLHHEINDLQFASVAGGLDYKALADSLTTERHHHSASRTASPGTYQTARDREHAMLTAIQSILNIWRHTHPMI